MLYKVGVTGRICSGKSACVRFLSKQPHAFGLNLDELAHSVYKRNTFFLQGIKQYFGEKNKEIFSGENQFFEHFNRKELGKIVFNDEKEMKILNNLMQKELKTLLKIHIGKLEYLCMKKNMKCVLFVEGALIIEAGLNTLFDEVWLTAINNQEIENRFLKRLKTENITEYKNNILPKILKYQLTDEDKSKYCTEIIDTSADYDITEKIYESLYSKLINEKLKY